MQGKGALPGAARLCVRAETRRAPKEKTWRAWLWCNLKPRNLPWCATVLLAALFLSGHGGVLHEVGVFMGILNGVAAEAVASVSEASKLAINGAEVLSRSSLLLRLLYDGVDLARPLLAASEAEAGLGLCNRPHVLDLPADRLHRLVTDGKLERMCVRCEVLAIFFRALVRTSGGSCSCLE